MESSVRPRGIKLPANPLRRQDSLCRMPRRMWKNCCLILQNDRTPWRVQSQRFYIIYIDDIAMNSSSLYHLFDCAGLWTLAHLVHYLSDMAFLSRQLRRLDVEPPPAEPSDHAMHKRLRHVILRFNFFLQESGSLKGPFLGVLWNLL